MKIHNIFQPNLLQKTLINPLTDQVNKPVIPIVNNNKEKCVVKKIFNTKSN